MQGTEEHLRHCRPVSVPTASACVRGSLTEYLPCRVRGGPSRRQAALAPAVGRLWLDDDSYDDPASGNICEGMAEFPAPPATSAAFEGATSSTTHPVDCVESAGAASSCTAGDALSRPQQRLSKAEKKARRKILHIQKKKEWRERRRQAAQQKSQEKVAARAAHLASLDEPERESFLAAEKARRDRMYHEKVAQSARVEAALKTGLRVALDLSYGERMSDKEQTSLARQLARCWGVNRKAPAPVGLLLTSLSSCPPGCLPRNKTSNDVEHWKVRRIQEAVEDVFSRDELIFLSPDAEEPVGDKLDPNAVYVIGGLVDSSVQKRTSLQKASDIGARCQRLPLAEHAPNASPRLPLTLTAVLEIFLALNNGATWPEALNASIAARHLRARTWENGRGARRQEARNRAAAKWGVEPKKPPQERAGAGSNEDRGEESDEESDKESGEESGEEGADVEFDEDESEGEGD